MYNSVDPDTFQGKYMKDARNKVKSIRDAFLEGAVTASKNAATKKASAESAEAKSDNKKVKSQARAVSKITAEMTDAERYEKLKNKKITAPYDTGDIGIDLRAGMNGEGVMLYTLSHELAHEIKRVSEETFDALEKLVTKALVSGGYSIESLIEDQKRKLIAKGKDPISMGTEKFEALAREEMVADACMKFLASKNAIAEIKALRTENKGLWNALKKFFSKLFIRLNDRYKKVDPYSVEGLALANMRDNVVKPIRDIFFEGTKKIAEHNKAKTKTKSETTVKKSTASAKNTTSNGKIDTEMKQSGRYNGVDTNGKKRYNKSRTSYNSFATEAMKWAHSDRTIIGEQKFFSKNDKWVLLEKSDDGFVEMGSYTNKQRIVIKEEVNLHNEQLRNSTETAREIVREDIERYGRIVGSDLRYNGNAEWQRAGDDRGSSVHQGKSESNGVADNQGGESGGRSEIKRSSRDTTYLSAVKRGDTEAAQKMVEKAAKANGYTVRAYHGTARGDRVGNVFLTERSTSGPMAFFTSSKEIAQNYAKDKKDTSIAYDEEYDSYYTQFRVNRGGKSVSIPDLWYQLSFEEKARIREAAPHITFDDSAENIIYDKNAKHGVGGLDAYRINSNRGNMLRALVEEWLEDGNLYGEEKRFLDVLKLIGIDNVEYRDPDERHEKVYDTYLKLTNPFDTDLVNKEFVADFAKWYEQQDTSKYEQEYANADLWDKNGRSYEDVIEKLNSDIDNGTTHTWTSIPDFLTDYLKSKGYDSIKDKGGKNGGDSHIVYIPFTSEQIKSADTITYDDNGNVVPLSERFNSKKKDIRYSSRKSYSAGQVAAMKANLSHQKVYTKSSAMQLVKELAPKIRNRSFEALSDELWLGLNTYTSIEDKLAFASDTSEMFIEKMLVDTEVKNREWDEAVEKMAYIKHGMSYLADMHPT